MRPLEQFQFSFILFVIFHRHFTQKKERHRRRKSRKKLYKIKKIKKFTQDSLYSFKKWKSRANFCLHWVRIVAYNSLGRRYLSRSDWDSRFRVMSSFVHEEVLGQGGVWRVLQTVGQVTLRSISTKSICFIALFLDSGLGKSIRNSILKSMKHKRLLQSSDSSCPHVVLGSTIVGGSIGHLLHQFRSLCPSRSLYEYGQQSKVLMDVLSAASSTLRRGSCHRNNHQWMGILQRLRGRVWKDDFRCHA